MYALLSFRIVDWLARVVDGSSKEVEMLRKKNEFPYRGPHHEITAA